MNISQGIMMCARYAFAPNFYHYCGPEQQQELTAYLNASTPDKGLDIMLKKFKTLSSYLQSIAQANGIPHWFDPRVVEAYWIGNELLNNVSPQQTYRELIEGQNLKQRMTKKQLRWLLPHINKHAKLHHSFHVFNVFAHRGHHTVQASVDTIDQCRIGWGRVSSGSWVVSGELEGQFSNDVSKNKDRFVVVDSQKIVYKNGKLRIKNEVTRKVNLSPGSPNLKKGDWVTFHWGWLCDRVSISQVQNLEQYTKFHLKLANQTS